MGFGIGNAGWKMRDPRIYEHSRSLRGSGQQRMQGAAESSFRRLKKRWETGSLIPVVSFPATLMFLVPANLFHLRTWYNSHHPGGKLSTCWPRNWVQFSFLNVMSCFPRTFFIYCTQFSPPCTPFCVSSICVMYPLTTCPVCRLTSSLLFLFFFCALVYCPEVGIPTLHATVTSSLRDTSHDSGT